MIRLQITILTTFLLSNPIWAYSADPATETNSVSKAAIEISAANYKPQTGAKTDSSSTAYTHESEKNNSLFHGALAKQGVKMNIVISRDSKVNYSPSTDTSEKNNSLFHGAMAR